MTGAATIAMAEGRRMMRLADEFEAEQFATLLEAFQQLLTRVFAELGGHNVQASGDTVVATFPIAKNAGLAAVAAHRAVATAEWPGWPRPEISVGLDLERATCSDLCDAAEGGQTFVSEATARLLWGEDLGELRLRDLGKQQTRRSKRTLRAYELVGGVPNGT